MKEIANHSSMERDAPRPLEIVGAGPLLSTIWKLGAEHSNWRYRFNLVRQTSDRGIVTDLFQPTDLIHFVRLIQVLAAVIAEDGCLIQSEQTTLRHLAAQLDDFLGGAILEADEPAAQAT